METLTEKLRQLGLEDIGNLSVLSDYKTVFKCCKTISYELAPLLGVHKDLGNPISTFTHRIQAWSLEEVLEFLTHHCPHCKYRLLHATLGNCKDLEKENMYGP